VKASKGFLLLDLAVVFLVVGTLLFFISTSFGCCVKNLSYMQDVVEAQSLAENFWADETIPIPERWQVQKSEHSLQGNLLQEVQVIDEQSSKVIYSLWWMP
jgi:Tfp pilus assembly protein PilE